MGLDGVAAVWREDDWEPPEPTGHLLPLDELRNKIAELQQDHRKKGFPEPTGRTIVVCHTLPYTCHYVSGDKAQSNGHSAAVNGHGASHAIEVTGSHSQPGSPTQLHPPSLPDSAAAALPQPSEEPPSPATILYDGQKQQGKASSENIKTTKSGLPSAKDAAHWVLSPRRVHAALNSGLKSLAQRSEIIQVAWPGDIRESDGSKVGPGSLSADQKQSLEQGLESLASTGTDGQQKGIQCVPVWMDDKTAHAFYHDYCKSFLWPTFHYLGLTDHQVKETQERAWKAYYAANQAYADRVADVYRDGDLIWVQDYHLLLVPQMLRKKFPSAAIGLFLHSPFPSSELFRCLPQRVELLNGMLGADLCCFQTYSYGRHFLSSCVRVCGYEALDGGIGIDAGGSITSIAYCPIGIDSERINAERLDPAVTPKLEALKQLYKGKKIIVGRDKLDVTKGVLPKLEAFEAFLEHYPEWVGNVVLIQVTTPAANDSPQISRNISRYVDHINGTYGNLSFAPIHHYHQVIDRDEYFALLSIADLALVTSVRDGMNTISMEYVLCQAEGKSPLILSEFTGVTGSMKDAVRVNPWDANGVARAINQCLTMGKDERERRHTHLYKRVTTQTSAVWAHTLILRLLESMHRHPTTEETRKLDTALLAKKFSEAKKRLLLFDYDGTLTPIVKVPSAAVPSPGLLNSLAKLASDPRNVVYIISGRDGDFLNQHLSHIKGLGFSAEHGSFLKEPGETSWKNLTEHIDMSWQEDIEEIFRHFEERTTGSYVEKKRASITFHYRNADPEYGEFQAKECQALLDTMADKLPIDVIVGKKNLEVRPAHTHKGEIVKRLSYQHADAEFLLCAGDDKTDEDMFRAIFTIESAVDSADGKTLLVTPPPSLSIYPSLAATLSTPVTEKAQADGGLGGAVEVGSEEAAPPVLKPLKSGLTPESLFTLGIIPNAARKTIAKWYVDEPSDLLATLSELSELA